MGYWPVKRIYHVLTLTFLIYQSFLNSDKVTPAYKKPSDKPKQVFSLKLISGLKISANEMI